MNDLATLARRIADLGGRDIAEVRLLRLPAHVPPWTDTGLVLAEGESVTWIACGRIVMAEALDLWGGPRFHLWARQGGRLFNGTRDTFTFRAERAGALELAVYSGEWKSPAGDLATPREAYAGLTGGLEALLLRWRGDPRQGLAGLEAGLGPGTPLGAERARLESPVLPPRGWRYLWTLGESEIFSAAREDGSPAIRIDAASDVGILLRDVEFPLADDTRLRWRWRVDELPSGRAEDGLPTHDYVSLALAFENGRDLTWYWSAALPREHGYACPLPGWNARETHVVVRSGGEGLGAWQREERAVRADYERTVGPPPSTITGAWLIAVSLFQHGRARAVFSDVVLEGAGRRLRVL